MKRLLLAVIAAALCVGPVACGSSSDSAKLTEVAKGPAAVKAKEDSEHIVQACLAKGGGHKAIEKCIAPNGISAKVKHCVVDAVAHDAVFHHARLGLDLVRCAEEIHR